MTAADLEIVLVPRRKIKTDLVDGVPRTQMEEYRIWSGMLARCNNPAMKAYPRYGGRGVSVCPSWQEDFKNFYCDMGPRPSKRHSVDRIDNDGNYEPGNCRWATSAQQAANKASADRSSGWYWRDEDVATLRVMWSKCYSDREISDVIGKSVGSVRLRAHRIGLKREKGISIMARKHPDLIHFLRNDGVDRFVEAISEKLRAESAAKRGKTAKEYEQRAQRVSAVLSTPSPRSEKMREMRKQGLTLAEIGRVFGVSRERVRQLEAIGFPDEIGGPPVTGRNRKVSKTKPEIRSKKIDRLCRAWNSSSREAKVMFLHAAAGFVATNISLADVEEAWAASSLTPHSPTETDRSAQ